MKMQDFSRAFYGRTGTACEKNHGLSILPKNVPFFFKWANNSPVLRKKWENFGKNTTFAHDFPSA